MILRLALKEKVPDVPITYHECRCHSVSTQNALKNAKHVLCKSRVIFISDCANHTRDSGVGVEGTVEGEEQKGGRTLELGDQ